MIVLTQKVGETIILDDRIEITVMDIQDNHAKISIDAPEEVKVDREENYESLPDYYAPPYG